MSDTETAADAAPPAEPEVPEGHRIVNIIKACTVTLKDDVRKILGVGKHVLPDEVADHWFVKAHTAPDPEAGTPADPDAPVQEGMVRVNIVKPCSFTLPNGEQMVIAPGMQDLPKEIAEHWFVKGHSDDPPDPVVQAGTPEYADMQKRRAARQHILDTAAEQAADTARQAVRDQTKASPPVDDAPEPEAPSAGRRRRTAPAADTPPAEGTDDGASG